MTIKDVEERTGLYNQTVFKLDSISFLHIWGSMLTWTTITVLCLIIGTLSYSKLPTEIPVQWSKGASTSLVNKNWIFICPVICILIRYLLKPLIYVKLQMNNYYGEIITEYLTNYMCFIVLSVEIFSILFTFGVVKSVVVLLFVDTVSIPWLQSQSIRYREPSIPNDRAT